MSVAARRAQLALFGSSDVVGQYRLHVDCIAAGERAHPLRAVLIEFSDSGVPYVYTFGPDACSRERLNVIAAGVSALADAMAGVNAQASI